MICLTKKIHPVFILKSHSTQKSSFALYIAGGRVTFREAEWGYTQTWHHYVAKETLEVKSPRLEFEWALLREGQSWGQPVSLVCFSTRGGSCLGSHWPPPSLLLSPFLFQHGTRAPLSAADLPNHNLGSISSIPVHFLRAMRDIPSKKQDYLCMYSLYLLFFTIHLQYPHHTT